MNIGDLVKVKDDAVIGYVSYSSSSSYPAYFSLLEFKGAIVKISKIYKDSASLEVSYKDCYIHLYEEDVEPYFLL